MFGFVATSFIKFNSFYYKKNNVNAAFMIVLSYVPGFVYYSHWKIDEANFIRSIFHKY